MKFSPSPHLRTIIEENSVRTEIDKASVKYPIIEDIFCGLTWRMAREPEVGYLIPRHNPRFSIIKINPNNELGHPGIIALYTFDDNEVKIVAVKIMPPSKPVKKLKRK